MKMTMTTFARRDGLSTPKAYRDGSTAVTL
jgi:hypothetical protein